MPAVALSTAEVPVADKLANGWRCGVCGCERSQADERVLRQVREELDLAGARYETLAEGVAYLAESARRNRLLLERVAAYLAEDVRLLQESGCGDGPEAAAVAKLLADVRGA